MPSFLDSELERWPVEPAERQQIREQRISMFGRTNWKGYPPDFLKYGRTWTVAFIVVGMPVAMVATLVGLFLAGSPLAGVVFAATIFAEWVILIFLLKWRRGAANRGAAVELGYPVCLRCGYFNLGHETGDLCTECGAPMVELPSEAFPPAEEDELVKTIRAGRRRAAAADEGHKPHTHEH
jgi:hypothetical protein